MLGSSRQTESIGYECIEKELYLFISKCKLFISYWGIADSPGFLAGSDSKESACSAGDPGLIPGSGSIRGEGNGYPLQYSCLENSMDRGDWLTAVHVIAKSWTGLSDSFTAA